MTILIISYDFYPDGMPNSFRWFNIAKKWVIEGHDVFILSADKNQYPSFEIIEGVKIYRTTEYFLGNFKYKYRNDVNNDFVKGTAIHNRFSSFFFHYFKLFYKATWANFFWPDHSFLWNFSAFALASKLIEEHNIKKVITVSWTFTAHLVGYKLKKKFNDIFWLADTIDPFCLNEDVNNATLYRKLNYLFERKIFYLADFNSVLTKNIKQKYISIFPLLHNKIGVNSNLFIPSEFLYEKKETNDSKVKIVFLGTLSSATRSPRNTLALFSNFFLKFPNVDVRIEFYGNITDTLIDFEKYPELLNRFIFLNRPVSKLDVELIIKNADILLNIGNNNEYQEPSKLIEYMYSSKRILNISSIQNDTSATLLKLYPYSKTILPNSICSELIMDDLFNFMFNNINNKPFSSQFFDDYSLDSVSSKYLNFLNFHSK